MKRSKKIISALGAVAISMPGVAAAQISDDEFLRSCELMREMSRFELEQFIERYPDDECAEIAALLLTRARTLPPTGDNNY